MSPKGKSRLTIVAAMIMAVAPSMFSYCQSVSETRAKYRASKETAEAGYTTLSERVAELQVAIKEHHESLIKLTAYVEIMRQANFGPRTSLRRTALSPPEPSTLARSLPALKGPDEKPELKPLPRDLNAAQEAMDAK